MSFYSIDNGNEGLGTFLNVEQYDRDLQKIGGFRIERGDDVLADIINGPIDAIKLDYASLNISKIMLVTSLFARKHNMARVNKLATP